jgi:ADP-ribose pyrophosphatase YjhB (NUDIX family)
MATGLAADFNLAGNRWIDPRQYERIQATMPIACVDVMLTSAGRAGLIRRPTPSGRRWCFIGGRILRDEMIVDAVARHVLATLGPAVRVDLAALKFGMICEYLTKPGRRLRDARQHSIGLTFTAPCHGEPVPQGEAEQFRWFRPDELGRLRYGFGQGGPIKRLARQEIRP